MYLALRAGAPGNAGWCWIRVARRTIKGLDRERSVRRDGRERDYELDNGEPDHFSRIGGAIISLESRLVPLPDDASVARRRVGACAAICGLAGLDFFKGRKESDWALPIWPNPPRPAMDIAKSPALQAGARSSAFLQALPDRERFAVAGNVLAGMFR